MQPDFLCPACGPVWLRKEKTMEVKITLSREDIKEIITNHVLKEVPVHTAGKHVFATERYGTWEVEITDEEEDV